MKEVLETIIATLVSDKNAISINQNEGEKDITFQVRVAENDMGRVIGRQGVIAKSIRTIMKSIASRENKRVTIEFLD